jgi:hypothetical protein
MRRRVCFSAGPLQAWIHFLFTMVQMPAVLGVLDNIDGKKPKAA